MTDDVLHRVNEASIGARRSFITWISEAVTENHDTPLVTSDEWNRISTRRPIPVLKMADQLLSYCIEHTQSLGDGVDLGDIGLLKASGAFGSEELIELAKFLKSRGLASFDGLSLAATPLGFTHIEQVLTPNAQSSQAFIAMSFDVSLKETYSVGIYPAIHSAGYRPMRIDSKEHANKIDDEIISEIRKSKFLVADFTGHRGGVYFEAGFAQGLGLPVIWTCKRTDMSNLHFDVRQYNCIDWESNEDLSARLQKRVVALIGLGPLKAS